MDMELMRYASGDEPLKRGDRRVAKRARETYDEVRLAALQMDGAMALGGHSMEGLKALDEKRKAEAGSDIAMNNLLMEVEATTIQQCRRIQVRLYDRWDL